MYERGQYDLISYIIILALLCTHCLYCDIFEGVPFNANKCLAEHRNFSPCISKTDFEDMCVYVYKIKTKHEKAKTKKVKKKIPYDALFDPAAAEPFTGRVCLPVSVQIYTNTCASIYLWPIFASSYDNKTENHV